jgi:hypothetical protein
LPAVYINNKEVKLKKILICMAFMIAAANGAKALTFDGADGSKYDGECVFKITAVECDGHNKGFAKINCSSKILKANPERFAECKR